MRRKLPFAVAAGLSVLLVTEAFATIIEPVGGALSINRQGQGFQTTSETTLLNPGDLVMVDIHGSANLFFPDGCKIVLQPGAVMTIGPLSPCAAKSLAQGQAQEGPPPPPGGPPLGPFGVSAFTGAALGTSGFIAYEIFHKSTPAPKPASP